MVGAARYGLLLLLPGIALELHRGDLGTFTLGDGVWLLYLGVGSPAAAFALWGYGLARLDAGRVAAVGTLLPLSGVAAAVLVLGEPLLPLQIAGGGLTLAGTWLATRAAAARI